MDLIRLSRTFGSYNSEQYGNLRLRYSRFESEGSSFPMTSMLLLDIPVHWLKAKDSEFNIPKYWNDPAKEAALSFSRTSNRSNLKFSFVSVLISSNLRMLEIASKVPSPNCCPPNYKSSSFSDFMYLNIGYSFSIPFEVIWFDHSILKLKSWRPITKGV